MSNTQAFDDKPDFPLSKQPPAFDEPIFDKFDDMDGHDTIVPSPKRVRTGIDVPELPQKSALRRSKLLDNHGLQLGGAVEAAELAEATTPHDVYLSSEEDASSDADDFSDYDYDSSVEDPSSPTRRNSHEDTARVVSVVFAGKPSLVDLPATRKRPVSSSSMGTTRTASSTYSTPSITVSTAEPATTEDRSASPASTSSQPRSNNGATTQRKSLLLSEVLIKKKPPFLSIDPYANGNTYSLGIPKALDSLEGESAKTPRTPTHLLNRVTRSFSLSRKRSRPAMNAASPQPPVPRRDTSADRTPVQSPATVVLVDQQQEQAKEEVEQQQQHAQHDEPRTPHTPITYHDIIRAVKRNATMMGGAPLPQSDILSPTSPGQATTAKRGILSGLSARRKSVKLTGKPF